MSHFLGLLYVCMCIGSHALTAYLTKKRGKMSDTAIALPAFTNILLTMIFFATLCMTNGSVKKNETEELTSVSALTTQAVKTVHSTEFRVSGKAENCVALPNDISLIDAQGFELKDGQKAVFNIEYKNPSNVSAYRTVRLSGSADNDQVIAFPPAEDWSNTQLTVPVVFTGEHSLVLIYEHEKASGEVFIRSISLLQ